VQPGARTDGLSFLFPLVHEDGSGIQLPNSCSFIILWVRLCIRSKKNLYSDLYIFMFSNQGSNVGVIITSAMEKLSLPWKVNFILSGVLCEFVTNG
jgi:hypothetical protein